MVPALFSTVNFRDFYDFSRFFALFSRQMKAPTGNEGAGDVASGLGDVSSAVWDVSSGSGRSVELLGLRQLPVADLGLRVAAHAPRAWTP